MAELTEGLEPEVTPSEDKETFSKEYVQDLRRENAGRRQKEKDLAKQVGELAAQVKASDDKDKSEAEKLVAEKTRLERELADAQREMAEKATSNEVRIQAAKMGFNSPDDAFRLVDLTLLESDDLGKSTEKALKALLKDKPYLAKDGKPAPPTPGAGVGKPATTDGKPTVEGSMMAALNQLRTGRRIVVEPEDQ